MCIFLVFALLSLIRVQAMIWDSLGTTTQKISLRPTIKWKYNRRLLYAVKNPKLPAPSDVTLKTRLYFRRFILKRFAAGVMYSYGPPHMAVLKQDDQLEHIYSSCVRIRDVALKTCQRRWTKGKSGERGSGISVQVPRHDDNGDDELLYFCQIGFASLAI